MQAIYSIVAVILAFSGPGQGETSERSSTLVAGLSGHMPNVAGGLPRLPQLPRLPRVPRPKWP